MRSDTKIRENPQMLRVQAKAKAWDGGTWSTSATNARIQHDGDLLAPQAMAHEPGGNPAMFKTRVK